MKKLLNELKTILRSEVKDIFQSKSTEISVMLIDDGDLDQVYQKTQAFILTLVSYDSLVTINFINSDEAVLKTLSLVQ